ncbi:hypothetical protein FBU30_002956 [Linnemannia zychae]|nr:hypothetical protein FBU30_002956 [Linnemannia zychae]
MASTDISSNRGRGRGNGGRGRGGNNRGDGNSNRGSSFIRDKSSSHGNETENNTRGRGNNRGNNNRRGNRARGKRGGGQRGGIHYHHNSRNYDSEEGDGGEEEMEGSSNHSVKYESNGSIEYPGERKIARYVPYDYNDLDDQGQRHIWHGPALLPDISDTRFNDLSEYNHENTIYTIDSMNLHIQNWEHALQELCQPHMMEDAESRIMLSWVVCQLQYLREIYPLIDANRYDYNIAKYFEAKEEWTGEKRTSILKDWFKNNSRFLQMINGLPSSAKHSLESSNDTLIHKKAKVDSISATPLGSSISNQEQRTDSVESSSHLTQSIAIANASPLTESPSKSTASAVTPTASNMLNNIPLISTVSMPLTIQQSTFAQVSAHDSSSLSASTQSTLTTQPQLTAAQNMPASARTTLSTELSSTAQASESDCHIPQYPSPVSPISPKQQSPLLSILSSATTSKLSTIVSKHSSLPKIDNQEYSQPCLSGGEILDPRTEEDTDELRTDNSLLQDDNSSTIDPESVIQKDLQHRKTGSYADEIMTSSSTKNTVLSQNNLDKLVTPQSNITPRHEDQSHHLNESEQGSVELCMSTSVVATSAAARVESEIETSIALQNMRSWMESESKIHAELIQRLLIKNTLLETKLDDHINRMESETQKQQAYRVQNNSWSQDYSSIKERIMEQDLKISQLERTLEAQARQTLEKDVAVARNELKEERMEGLAKDLEIKRAEAKEAMAKARAEMRDARHMVAEAREERANAMERAAKAEADNQMLLRVINELQGTGWKLSEKARDQSQDQSISQDEGIHDGPSHSLVMNSEFRLDHRIRPLTAPEIVRSSQPNFRRFGTVIRPSFSSSSTESLTDAPRQIIRPLEAISIKLESEFINRLEIDPDMTEDDEGRTDTDHDATEDEVS